MAELSIAECKRSLAASKKGAIAAIRKHDFQRAEYLLYQADYWLKRVNAAANGQPFTVFEPKALDEAVRKGRATLAKRMRPGDIADTDGIMSPADEDDPKGTAATMTADRLTPQAGRGHGKEV